MHLRSVKPAAREPRSAAPSRRSTTTTSWQRARLTLACVTREAGDASRLLDEAERWLLGPGVRARVCRERELVHLEDGLPVA